MAKAKSAEGEQPTFATEQDHLDWLLETASKIDGGDRDFKVEAAPTGISSFDQSTGIGGFPRNRISICQGEEHSGKTLLLLTTIATAQKAGGRCAFIDAEHALTPQFAKMLGVDWDALEPFVRRPRTLDQCYDILKEFVRSGLFDVVGFDSVTALTTRAAIDAAAGSAASRAAVARMHSEELPKIIACQHARTAIIFINQMRENPNPPSWWKSGKLLYAPGGKALKHASSMTVEVKPGETYTEGNRRVGHRLKTHIVKNKVGIPFRKAEFDLMYSKGLDLTTDMIDSALELGIIERRGSNYYIQITDEDAVDLGQRTYVGKAELEDGVRTDEFIRGYIEQRVVQALAED